jgi:alcohol dehydrogenase class IV
LIATWLAGVGLKRAAFSLTASRSCGVIHGATLASLPPEVIDEEARGPPGLEATFRARKRYAEIVTRNDAGNANRPLDL